MKGVSLIASGRKCLFRNKEDHVCGSGSTGFNGFHRAETGEAVNRDAGLPMTDTRSFEFCG
jgi:hypothetical protein